jgi:hypothetical protein
LCHVPTLRLRAYELPYVVFLVIYSVWQSKTVTACPTCIRPKLLKNSLFNLFTANVCSPLPLLWNAWLWTESCRGGHSRSVELAFRDPTLAEATDSLAGITMVGAASGGFMGSFACAAAGLLGGAIGFRLAAKAPDPWLDPVLAGEVGAALAGALLSLLWARSVRLARRSLGLYVLGIAIWLAVRTFAAEADLVRQLRGTALSWGLVGALVATAGLARTAAARAGTDNLEGEPEDEGTGFDLLISLALMLLVKWFRPQAWGVPLAGLLGGIAGGVTGGVFIGAFGFGTAEGAAMVGAAGAALAALGGFLGGREAAYYIEVPPVSGRVQEEYR